MSKEIDKRIVEMTFDNKAFEKNASQTISTLNNLKKNLNLSGATKGLETVSDTAKKVNLGNLTNAVETVATKFSALEVMAVTALVNITNSAVNSGKRIVSSLTIDPIRTGFQEYETQINAVQTILANTASKGTTLDQVNQALDELNLYADKTIYNFTEMTRNIGTFTAAGIDLKTSTSAIQGIANLAAVSGSTSQQASVAMYQLSQALATGTVRLMDWNSVVNAGMGGQVFQDALKRTSKELNTGAEAAIKAKGSFRESLQMGWLTSEVLTETLKKFTVSGANEYIAEYTGLSKDAVEAALKEAEARYGEADAIEKASQALAEKSGKNADEIKQALEFAKTAEDAATKVKTLTQLMETLKEAAQSGWTQTWEILIGDFNEAKGLFTGISNTIGGIIDRSAKARNDMLQGWKDLGGRTSMLNSFTNIFQSLGSIINSIGEAFREIFPRTTSDQLFKITKAIENFTSHLKLSDKQIANIKDTFKGLFTVLNVVKKAFLLVAGIAAKMIMPIGKVLVYILNGILSVTAALSRMIMGVENAFSKLDITKLNIFSGALGAAGKKMHVVADSAKNMKESTTSAIDNMKTSIEKSKIVEVLDDVWEKLKLVAKEMGAGIGKLFQGLDFQKVFEVVNAGALGGIGVLLFKFINNFTKNTNGMMDSISGTFKNIGGIAESFKGIFDGVRGAMEQYQNKLKADVLTKIATAIAILVGSILVLSVIDGESLTKALMGLSIVFLELFAGMKAFSMLGPEVTKNALKSVILMTGMSTAVLILASAVKKLSSISFKGIIKGLIGVAGLMAIVVVTAKAMSGQKGKMMKGATSVVIFAAAIKILASACADLAELSFKQLGKALLGVGVLMTAISLFINNTKFSAKAIGTAAGILILSKAMQTLAAVCVTFGDMKWSAIKKGLTAVGALLLEISIFTRLTGDAKKVIATSASLYVISKALLELSKSISSLGLMSKKELTKGMLAIASSLSIIGIAVKLMPKNILGVSIGLIAMGQALKLISDAFSTMGAMKWKEVGKGLAALGGSLTILTVALNYMSSTIGGATSLLVASTALSVLASVLERFGNMGVGKIIKSFASLAGVFAIMGGAAAVLSPLLPVIIGLSGAMIAFGLGVLSFGAGMTLVGTGLTAMSLGLSSLAAAMSSSVKSIQNGFVSLIKGFADAAPHLITSFKIILLTFIDVMVECVPAIADGFLALMIGMFDSLGKNTTKLVNSVMDFLINLISAVSGKMPKLVEAGVKFILSFFKGISKALKGIDTKTLLEAASGLAILSAMTFTLSTISGMIPSAMVGVAGLAVIVTELSLVLAVIGGFAQIPGLSWLIGEGSKLLSQVGFAIGDFVGSIVGGFMGGASKGLPEIGNSLSGFMTNVRPFIEGASKIDAGAMAGVKSLATAILLLTAADVLDGITSWLTGGSSISDFSKQISQLGPYLKTFAASTKGLDSEAVANAGNAAKAVAEFAKAIPNEGGAISYLVGENNLLQFGKQLAQFGPYLMAFSKSVTGMDSSVVTNAANSANAISAFAKDIPNTGGLLSWFTGNNDMSTFGKNLASFGKNFSVYAMSVKSVDSDIVTKTSNAASSLVALANALPQTDGWVKFNDTTLADFGSSLPALGRGITNYSNSVKDIDGAKVSASITYLRGMINLLSNMNGADYGASISSFKSALSKLASSGINAFTDSVKASEPKLTKAAISVISTFSKGISSGKEALTKSVTSVIKSALNSTNSSSLYSNFYSAGKYATQGFADGVIANQYKATAAGKSIAKASYKAAMKELDAHSPSRKFKKVGGFAGEGYVDGMLSYVSKATDVGKKIAKSSLDGVKSSINRISEAINGDIDSQPTIRPVLDLTSLESDAGKINAMFSRTQAMGIEAQMTAQKESEIQNGEKTASPSGGNSYVFEQNNYSPKALSRIDIYRQTKNQFSALERMVET